MLLLVLTALLFLVDEEVRVLTEELLERVGVEVCRTVVVLCVGVDVWRTVVLLLWVGSTVSLFLFVVRLGVE